MGLVYRSSLLSSLPDYRSLLLTVPAYRGTTAVLVRYVRASDTSEEIE